MISPATMNPTMYGSTRRQGRSCGPPLPLLAQTGTFGVDKQK